MGIDDRDYMRERPSWDTGFRHYRPELPPPPREPATAGAYDHPPDSRQPFRPWRLAAITAWLTLAACAFILYGPR